MNLSDIARLKYANIEGDTLLFVRNKTAYNRKVIPIEVYISSELKQIISRWGIKPARKDQYIFSIITPGDPVSERKQIQQAIKQLNKYVGGIAQNVGIKDKVTSYTARHSFATVLKLSGENIAYISEALGHSNLKTTENYLKSFDKTHRVRASKKLL